MRSTKTHDVTTVHRGCGALRGASESQPDEARYDQNVSLYRRLLRSKESARRARAVARNAGPNSTYLFHRQYLFLAGGLTGSEVFAVGFVKTPLLENTSTLWPVLAFVPKLCVE